MKTKKQILHEYFSVLGKKGGPSRSPAKIAGARLANKARWKNHVKKIVDKKQDKKNEF